MFLSFFIKIIEFIFLFFFIKISKLFCLSYIFGTDFGYLNFFSGVFPSFFCTFPLITIIYSIFYLSLNKIGSISSSIILYILLNKIKFKKLISILILSSQLLILIFFTKIPIFYSIGWIISILLILFIENNLFIKCFISTWTGHAFGTIYYYFFKNQLSKELYISIIPITWIERIILSISIYTFYKLFKLLKNNYLNSFFIIKTYKSIIKYISIKTNFKKNYAKK